MNKKGLTLIEIVISIAILSMMAAIFLTSMVTYYRYISDGRNMTEDVFSAQKFLEEKIESIKQAIFNDETPSSSEATDVAFTLFSDTAYEREVEGYRTEAIISGSKKLVTIVGSNQLVYPVPEINNITLRIRKDHVNQPDNYEYALKFEPDLSLRGDFDIIDPESVFLVNRHEWFVSRKGFSIPIETNSSLITEGEVGRLYPMFPNDYNLIPIRGITNQLDQDDLSSIMSDYAGRHIVYTASPFALSGKKGLTIFSQPIYLHGPTVTNGLVLHLDASIISKDTTKSDISVNGSTIEVNQWDDLSGSNNHLSSIGASPPLLTEVQYQDDVYVWGKCLGRNESDNTAMAKSSFNDSPSSEMTIFIVAKINDTHPGESIVSGNDWDFGWNDEGNLAYRIGGDYSTAATALLGAGIDNHWHVFTGVVSGGNVAFRIDGDSKSGGTVVSSAEISTFSMELNDVEIAEILVYDDALNTSTSLPEVENYLIDKYDPDPTDIMSSILYLKSIPARTVLKNETFSPPNPVPAMMTNGTTQNVFVNWNNPETVDTSTIGTYAINASAVMDNTKTVTMTINVVGIDHLEHHEHPLMNEKDVPLTLPAILNAVLTNGSNRTVAVDWISNSSNLSIAGNILVGDTIDTYNNGITATATMDSSKSISYDVIIAKSYLVSFLDWDGTLLKQTPVAENTPAIAPDDPERDGYTFIGWDKAFNNITSDLIVQAQYTPIQYTVRFENWDGTLLKQQDVEYNQDATPPSNPTRTGYTFTGWSGSYANVTSDLTITALYDIQSFTVRFVDGFGVLLKEEQVTYGGSGIAPETNPSQTGYNFNGWAPSYDNITTDLTVTAQWTANTYTVTRNLNYSGAPSYPNINVTYGSPYGALGTPSRSGYSLNGWFTSSSGGTEITSATVVSTANNHTIYAQWSISTPLEVLSIYTYGWNSFSLTFSNQIHSSSNPNSDWSNDADDDNSIVLYSYNEAWWSPPSPGNYSIQVTDINDATITVELRLKRTGPWWNYSYTWEIR